MSRIIASSVRNKEHIAMYDDMTKERLEGIDTSAVFIYLMDIVKEPALVFLAYQFDVLGFKGWALAQTEAQRRELLKQAIELHRTKGTPFAIKSAISRAVTGIAYEDITIQEGLVFPTFIFDGSVNFNGSHYFGSGHWATFRVTINVTGFTPPITTSLSYLILQLILEYKNARSHLIDISYGNYYEDSFNVSEEFNFEVQEMPSELTMFSFLFVGENDFDGSRQFQQDVFEITIIELLPPTAEFTADDTTPTYGDTINFTDASTDTPTSWSWEYTDPDSVTSVFSTAQNPSLLVNKVGLWTIKLTATNAYGSDDEIKTDYIDVIALPETLSHHDRIITAGGDYVDTWIENQILTYLSKFENSISGLRSKIVRLELPIIGSGAIAKMIPYLYNKDGSLTPIGNAVTTNNGFTDPDCLEGSGRQGDGVAKYTDTGIIPSSEAEVGQDSIGVFVYVKDGTVGYEAGALDVPGYILLKQNDGTYSYHVLNNLSFSVMLQNNPVLLGSIRVGTGAFDYYTISNNTITAAGYSSTGEISIELYGHCHNHFSAGAISMSNANQYLFMITDGMSLVEYAIFKAAFDQLLTDLGV